MKNRSFNVSGENMRKPGKEITHVLWLKPCRQQIPFEILRKGDATEESGPYHDAYDGHQHEIRETPAGLVWTSEASWDAVISRSPGGPWVGQRTEVWQVPTEVVPLQSPALHRNFAGLSGVAESFRREAEKYGFLEWREPMEFYDRPQELPVDFVRGKRVWSVLARESYGEKFRAIYWPAEPVAHWKENVAFVNLLLALWDSKGNPAEIPRFDLSNFAKRRRDPFAKLPFIVGAPEECGFNLIEAEFRFLSQGDVPTGSAAGAKAFVRSVIEWEVERGTYVLPAIGDNKGYFRIVAKGLRAGIFLSLSAELMGGVKLIRQCSVCGTWFIPDVGQQKYCEDSCNERRQNVRRKSRQEDLVDQL